MCMVNGMVDTFFLPACLRGTVFFILMIINGIRSQGSEGMESSTFSRRKVSSSTDLDGQGRTRRRQREVGLAGRRRGNSPCLRPQCTEGEDGASLWEVVARLCLRRIIYVQNLLGEQLVTTTKSEFAIYPKGVHLGHIKDLPCKRKGSVEIEN